MRFLSAVVTATASLALLAGCGGSSDPTAGGEHDATGATGPHTFEGGIVSPRRAAPPLRLRDVDGRLVDLATFKGSPVMVTFVYARCPDVCPLIMQNLRRVRNEAGPLGRKMRVLAVSVDPAGDTPAVVRNFLASQRLRSFVRYLVGTRAELEPVWKEWQIDLSVPRDSPELLEHSALIYGITASGELATAYPVNFPSEAVARDLALLARS